MIEEFETEEQLYNRLRPALTSKKNELKKLGFKEITNQEIWKYLKDSVWSTRTNLTLADLVNDILHLDKTELQKKDISGAVEHLF